MSQSIKSVLGAALLAACLGLGLSGCNSDQPTPATAPATSGAMEPAGKMEPTGKMAPEGKMEPGKMVSGKMAPEAPK